MQPGDRIGSYIVGQHLGSGGMGAVYRAKDTRLDREVALKVLPGALAADPERLARFQREARTLASLNHTNIAQIFGVEDAGAAPALVMELVEGETVAGMVASGPVPVADALEIATQIALGLQAAHEAGVVHRDLKPQNIKVRPDGTVKILDFGLAKAMAPDGGTAGGSASIATVTSPAHTMQGTILGTAAYMSPEQARGRPVDRRTDVWAFGCVLYELLTGRRAFPGDGITDVLAAIVRGEPDWSLLPADTPASVHRLLRWCLTKDAKDRPSDISIARLQIAEARNQDALTPPAAGAGSVPAATNRRFPRAAIAAAALAGAVLATAVLWSMRPASVAVAERRAMLSVPDTLQWIGQNGTGLAISSDGAWVAYVAVTDETRMYVHSLEDDVVRPIDGSEGAINPFFSPDGRQVGFVSRGRLFSAPVAGGAPFEIGPIDAGDRGITWAEDGFIYSGGTAGLSRIPQGGGTRETLTTVNKEAGEVGHRFPAAVPGQNAIVFTVFKGALENARLAVFDIASRTITQLTDLQGHSARIVPGRIFYGRSGTLMSAGFDAATRTLTSTPEPVLPGVLFNNGGATHFAISNEGTLVYVSEADSVPLSAAVWVDRSGRAERTSLPPGRYMQASLSPDGAGIAVVTEAGATSSIAVWDLTANRWTAQLTGPGYRESPMWLPDGETLVFTYRAGGIGSPGYISRQRLMGGARESLTEGGFEAATGSSGQYPESVTADGRLLFFHQLSRQGQATGMIDLETRQSRIVLDDGVLPMISPDGRFLVTSRYGALGDSFAVRPFPDVDSRQWSIAGLAPQWSPNGRELLFWRGSQLMALAVNPAAPDFSAPPRVVLQTTRRVRSYGAHPDGRILILESSGAVRPMPRVIFNWRGGK